MTGCNTEILVKRWDTPSYEIEIIDDDDNPIDITTATVYFTARLPKTVNDPDDSTAKITKVIAPPHTDPLNGKTMLELDATDTDTPEYYVREIKLVDSGVVLSTLQWDLVVEQNITKTV